MISKQRLMIKLKRLETEIEKLREEIEESERKSPVVSLRGKYGILTGIAYKDVIEAKGIWKPAAAE